MLKRLFVHYIAEEAKPMLRLAMPLVCAELGWMTMGIVDTMMVGRQTNSAVAIVGSRLSCPYTALGDAGLRAVAMRG